MKKINQFKEIFFKKAKPLWGGAYKNRINRLGQLEQSQFPLKYLKLILVNLFWITPNGTKQLKVTKNPYLEQSETLFEW